MISRTQTADLLKGIAVLLMIQVHILELFATNEIYNSNAGSIVLFLGGPPVAPLFMAVFGYFIATSQKTLRQLIIRGTKIFGLGMLLNIVLNLNLIISVQKGIYNVDLLPYIFGDDILQFAGIGIIVIALLKKLWNNNLIFTFSTILISAFLGHFLLNYIPENTFLKYLTTFFYGSTPWSYFPLFPWLAYPLAGMAYYQLRQEYDLSFLDAAKAKFLTGLLFLLFLVFTFRYAFSVSASLTEYYHHGIIFCLWVIIFLSFYSFFMKQINDLAGQFFLLKYLKWLGKNVTLIYFIQWTIIGNTATAIYKTVSSPLYLVLWFVGVLLASSGLVYMLIWMKGRK